MNILTIRELKDKGIDLKFYFGLDVLDLLMIEQKELLNHLLVS